MHVQQYILASCVSIMIYLVNNSCYCVCQNVFWTQRSSTLAPTHLDLIIELTMPKEIISSINTADDKLVSHIIQEDIYNRSKITMFGPSVALLILAVFQGYSN